MSLIQRAFRRFASNAQESSSRLKFNPSHRSLQKRYQKQLARQQQRLSVQATNFLALDMMARSMWAKMMTHKGAIFFYLGAAIVLRGLYKASVFLKQSSEALSETRTGLGRQAKDKISEKAHKYLVVDLWQKGPVEYIFSLFWLRTFTSKQIEEALLHMVYKCVESKQFQDSGEKFGQDWIEKCCETQPVIKEATNLSEETFTKDKRIVDASVDICGWVASQPEMESSGAELMTQVCAYRPKTFDILMWQLACSASSTYLSSEIQSAQASAIIEVVNRKETRQGIIDSQSDLMSQLIVSASHYFSNQN